MVKYTFLLNVMKISYFNIDRLIFLVKTHRHIYGKLCILKRTLIYMNCFLFIRMFKLFFEVWHFTYGKFYIKGTWWSWLRVSYLGHSTILVSKRLDGNSILQTMIDYTSLAIFIVCLYLMMRAFQCSQLLTSRTPIEIAQPQLHIYLQNEESGYNHLGWHS